ncbi:MAG TPA: hypothetical protein VK831_05230 [Candidatus Deferrimicrobiaceae bacterium]|nr:hypothetical protein [Candidatus Deferrimicrobiaceae bacterium]
MTEQSDPHAADAMVGPHAQPADHGGDHGHDDHGHDAESLGPLDTWAWGAGVLGIILGLAVAVALLAGGG